MTILLTGGAGFIGFYTAKALLERGTNVVIVDVFNDYYDVNLKRARIDQLKKKYEFTCIEADISDYKILESTFKKYKFDKICHLGAQAGVRYSLEDPLAYGYSNLIGTLNLLELCRKYNVRDFVLSSSSSVYGNSKKIPFSENYPAVTPISLYAATKKSNEEMAYVYHHLFRVNCTILRLFTIYGPWGRPDMAYFTFTKNIIEGKPIEVFNHGEMKRDFTYIGDALTGIIAAIDKPFPFEIINLGRGKPEKIKDFIKEIEINLGIEAEKKMMPMQPGDVPITFSDTSKAKKLLGYEPNVSIEEGVKNFVDWYKSYYKIL